MELVERIEPTITVRFTRDMLDSFIMHWNKAPIYTAFGERIALRAVEVEPLEFMFEFELIQTFDLPRLPNDNLS